MIPVANIVHEKKTYGSFWFKIKQQKMKLANTAYIIAYLN